MFQGRDLDWDEAMTKGQPRRTACRWRPPIRFISSTPRAPPAAQGGGPRQRRPHGGLKWTMKAIYNVDAGDVYWAASDVGWVVGHSYIVYGPCSRAARPSCTKANRWAHPTPAPSGG
jgi:propionyl-CoA synthetase